MSDAVDLVRVMNRNIAAPIFGRALKNATFITADIFRLKTRTGDVVIVQAGLHHLPRLPEDLKMTLAEMLQVLRPVMPLL